MSGFGFVFGQFFGFGFDAQGFISAFVLQVEYAFFFDVDFIARLIFCADFDEIADFAFQAHIGYQAFAGFGVKARHIACVGVAVGVAVGYVEKVNEFIAVLDGHVYSPLYDWVSAESFLVK